MELTDSVRLAGQRTPAIPLSLAYASTPSFLYGGWGSELRSSRIHSKHFMNWAFSTALPGFLFSVLLNVTLAHDWIHICYLILVNEALYSLSHFLSEFSSWLLMVPCPLPLTHSLLTASWKYPYTWYLFSIEPDLLINWDCEDDSVVKSTDCFSSTPA